MPKLHVPDGAWLVCSEGMQKQQIKVTSQGKVTIAGGYLKATVDDRPGGNFICGKMMLIGAIAGAALGLALVAGSILTGGALAVAAVAAAGAALGAGVSMIPSICGMLLNEWTPYDNNVLTVGRHPLLENSQIPCRLGGNVIILYSEKAADEFTDITIGRTAINTIGVIALSYLMYPALSAIGTTAATAKATVATFGWSAGINYVGGVVFTTGISYGIGYGIDQGKGWGYSQIPMGDGTTLKNYVDGFESDPEKLVENQKLKNSDGEKAFYENVNDIGGANGPGRETIGDRTSQYSVTERSTSVRLDDIEEHGPTAFDQSGRIQAAIEGRNPTNTQGINVINQDFGGRYQEVERISVTTNSQYSPLSKSEIPSKMGGAVKNTYLDQKGLPSFSKNEGPKGGGIVMGLIQDAYKGVTNFILKGEAEDLIQALQNEEAMARAKINVLAGKD
ncbi:MULTISPECIES: PAAR-like protein [Chryseobacterium]|uniref:DUF4280 domain-containing protein n=1 Tax=Chryseobacterium camelliae TaxID=1265445 RepID=A0ABU0TJL0_9FLAO|nr:MULTISPECIES: PAAR-like protein [Chryseobacterium]MDT3408927.1 hypothetical protein [Pseudacidovorax intermedius]MDQ1097217.1 hypothetical protein [Chryseobacterium camelliae]MDQ1101152.1 hypothetical protein [Chryseobacterium sp. SORGH_AS_1048]MDR6084597.1 hypothetical protein [Chryseobacterium sp. SORGH_AS_0909]MDR6132869.1 hypothetical protein [Chryseobacterium sp. SORGH_AS_1175]